MIITDMTHTPISAVEARNFITEQVQNFGIFIDISRCSEIIAMLRYENLKLTRQVRRDLHAPDLLLQPDNKTYIINLLVKAGISPATFSSDGSNGLVLNKTIGDLIINSPKYSEELKHTVELIFQASRNNNRISTLLSYAESPRVRSLSKQRHMMGVVHPDFSIKSTSRLQTSNPSIQSIPRDTPDIICEPQGYTLVRCDSAQIEPKINFSYYLPDPVIKFLITYYKDAYFGILHFCTMSDVDLLAMRSDLKFFKPMEITQEIKDLRQSLKTLTNAGSYGSDNLERTVVWLAEQYKARIVNHPMRLELDRKVREQVKRGVTTFYGAFGTPVTPSSNQKYSEGEGGWEGHLIRCGINNPVQTTASELMLHSVDYARKVIAFEAKDTHVAFYKHDEAIFYVSDEDMANGVGEKLSKATAYEVEGWIPIESDAVFGVKHSEVYPTYLTQGGVA